MSGQELQLKKQKIVSIQSIGKQLVYDIEIPDSHNFILANGMVAHNCAHAVSYSYLSYYTAWLKHYYPTEFMCAIINSEDSNSDKVQEYKQVAKEMNIKITPPDINKSDLKYNVIANYEIATGLLAIKGIGDVAIEHIIANRPYTSFSEFIMKNTGTKGNRSPVTKTVIESLAKAGCFDSLNITRKNALECWPDIKIKISAATKKALKNNISIDLGNITKDMNHDDEYTKKQVLQNEMEVMGQYLSGTHNDIYGGFFKNTPDIISLNDINNISSGKSIKIEAVIKIKVKELKIKKKGRNFGRTFAKYLLEDANGKTAELTLWPDYYEKFRTIFQDGIPIRAICEVNEYLDSKSLLLKHVEEIPDRVYNGKIINHTAKI